MSFEYSQELANDYEKLFETDEGYDVIIYAGDNENVYLLKLQGLDIVKLSPAVDEFKIQRLIIYIREYLIKHQHEFLQNNPVEILETVYQRETFTDLWNYYVEKICDKPDVLFKSDKFINLNATLLELLLKRNDLSLDEIDIWNNYSTRC
ncbi:hypothetical protein RhiirB3_444301 [Rhizophagus irregularis]|nr:hypothetical protein RhiirB3_444301 [Rhizophagus irregularis]